MLMHLTDQLPNSNYDTSDNPNSLRLFGAGVVSKKRNTTGMELNKGLNKVGKRGASSLEHNIPTTD
jgi:hypothetical protein